MGLYVKNMKMPSCCADGCDFLEPMGLKCLRTHKFLDREDYRYERPEDCPLVEVSESHGRLIDASYKVDMPFYDDEYEEYSMRTVTVEELIMMADNEVPTVIEAEGRDE